MKNLSVFQLTLLAVFGGLAVAGVLIFALAVGGNKTATIGPVVIWGTLDSSAFDTVLRAAADANSALNQVTYVQKDPTTYESDLTDALASGTGPDLFLMTQDYAVKDAGEVTLIPFSSLSQSQFQNTFVEAANPFISTGGIIAVPLIADPLVLYWNKDMLASAGFSEPPQYWDELYAIAQQLTTRDSTGSILQSAIALGEYQNVDNAKAILATLILQAGGQITSEDSAGHLQSALVPKGGSAAAATTNALRFFTEFADPSNNYYSWNRSLPDAQQAFAAGTLALYLGYASEEALIARTNPNLDFGATSTLQVRMPPQGVPVRLDTATVYGFAIAKSSKNPLGALQVAAALSDENTAAAFSTALGLPSARRDVLSQPATGDQNLFNKMVIISYPWLDPDPDGTNQIFQAMIEDTTSGALLLSDAVSRADQQLSHLLTQGQ